MTISAHRRHLLLGLSASAGTAAFPGLVTAQGRPAAAPASARVRLGIDLEVAGGFQRLRGRRIGLVTNQTGVDGQGQFTRSALKAGLGDNLKVLFGPEHGLDTRARAGARVADSVDDVTGLPVRSLYGTTRKPTPAMLEGLDALVFDIQDIGIRSYTYISTMALCMEACGEAGIDFVVLDRPNPMGGERMQGPPLEPRWTSFVGQVPVPYLHGLTVGELARMIVGERWIRALPRSLDVIAMDGWSRSMNWGATRLGWVATSPNIPRWVSPYYCAATGILGELRGVEIGVNSPEPFEVASAAGVNPRQLAAALTRAFPTGVRFAPYTSTRSPGMAGVRLSIDPNGNTDLMALGIALACEINARARAGARPWELTGATGIDLFKKAYGSEALWDTVRSGAPWQPLVAGWRESLTAFRTLRAPYLLYR